MNSLIDFFERLLTNFTWSRLTFTFVLQFLLISAIFAYEAYTQHFALQRLDKQVKIFDQLVTLSEKLNLEENDMVLNESFKNIVAAFNSQVNYKSYLSVDGASLTTRYSFPEWFKVRIGAVQRSSVTHGKRCPPAVRCRVPGEATIVDLLELASTFQSLAILNLQS